MHGDTRSQAALSPDGNGGLADGDGVLQHAHVRGVVLAVNVVEVEEHGLEGDHGAEEGLLVGIASTLPDDGLVHEEGPDERSEELDVDVALGRLGLALEEVAATLDHHVEDVDECDDVEDEEGLVSRGVELELRVRGRDDTGGVARDGTSDEDSSHAHEVLIVDEGAAVGLGTDEGHAGEPHAPLDGADQQKAALILLVTVEVRGDEVGADCDCACVRGMFQCQYGDGNERAGKQGVSLLR